MNSDGKFDREAEPNPKAAYWQERAAFWRDEALRLGYVPEGERDTRPPWSQAPDWAEWLAQDADGDWAWFEDEPTTCVVLGMWVRQNGQKGQTGEVGVGCEPNPEWKSTLEPRPAQEGHGTKRGDCDAKLSELMAIAYARGYMGLNDEQIADIQRGMRKALDDLEHKLPSMLPDAPDMVIPKDAVEAMCGYSWVEELAEAGYRIEVDEHGLRGWKD